MCYYRQQKALHISMTEEQKAHAALEAIRWKLRPLDGTGIQELEKRGMEAYKEALHAAIWAKTHEPPRAIPGDGPVIYVQVAPPCDTWRAKRAQRRGARAESTGEGEPPVVCFNYNAIQKKYPENWVCQRCFTKGEEDRG